MAGFFLYRIYFRFSLERKDPPVCQLHRRQDGSKAQDGSVSIVFQDKRYRLEITAYPGEGTALRSPISGEMTGKVNESLQATVQVRLYEKGSLAFSGEGRNAGLEIAGPVEEILSETR